jgi:hypothetical protein
MTYRWITLSHNRSYLKSTVKLSKKLDIKRKVCTICRVVEASIFGELNITKTYFKTMYKQRSKTSISPTLLFTNSITFYYLFTGHVCLTDNDKDNARNNKGSLLYGELLPRGANKVRHRSFSDMTYLAVICTV